MYVEERRKGLLERGQQINNDSSSIYYLCVTTEGNWEPRKTTSLSKEIGKCHFKNEPRARDLYLGRLV